MTLWTNFLAPPSVEPGSDDREASDPLQSQQTGVAPPRGGGGGHERSAQIHHDPPKGLGSHILRRLLPAAKRGADCLLQLQFRSFTQC